MRFKKQQIPLIATTATEVLAIFSRAKTLYMGLLDCFLMYSLHLLVSWCNAFNKVMRQTNDLLLPMCLMTWDRAKWFYQDTI